MNKLLIVCLTYGFFMLEVALIMAGAWFCEKLDPESDLASSIWDEILPPDRPRAAAGRAPEPVNLNLGPVLSEKAS